MEKYVITISRQYGSFGRLVAKKLSEQLHIDFLDRDIVEETAKRMIPRLSRSAGKRKSPTLNFRISAIPLDWVHRM